ncbi:hypothetical protein UA08_07356 [Talaromyces atroroseus]|uniref:Zn(2)-C6 fungal-type domain-containing protein n=1 Tax=Talaromyces atroroseus TaxID=1441469 RepID=A0A225AN67_TALAT|nr:hypothetical protein UA08_07356 [Talaromyces atroroseus]OKL57039.1 hypothetical protein UA08_07356 [Talaromyces atroroseus]
MQANQPLSPRVVSKRGRNAPRSKNGCWTCRTKKVKCDEERPRCGRCLRLQLFCDYAPRQFKCDSLIAPNKPSASSMPTHLPELSNSACSIDLSSADHEAIRYFRTTFASIRHTKNPHYSMYAIIFNMAQREPMVMRAILALGNRELESRRQGIDNGLAVADGRTRKHSVSRVQHYSAALRLMADSLGGGSDVENRPLDIDTIYATLFLMVVYESKYGDARCSGLSNHLAGAAVVLKHHFRFPLQMAITSPDQPSKVALMQRGQENNGQSLSLFSARVLVYLATHDASASTFGLGGEINAALNQILPTQNPGASMMNGPAARLHRFSYPLYRTIWGNDYPQSELLDDVNNRDIFALATARAQLRFMVAQLAKLHGELARQRCLEIGLFVQDVESRFGELLEVAGQLSIATDSSQRLVANIRNIVPQYYATLIEFGRVKRRLGLDDSPPSEDHMRNIMNLALQMFKHQGDEALVRIAWPLFIVGLETSDELHREWILSRFQAMGCYGKNIQRAHRFLMTAVKLKALHMNLGGVMDLERIQSESEDLKLFVI